MAIYSGFTHKQLWFSIVMLVYRRVIVKNNASAKMNHLQNHG